MRKRVLVTGCGRSGTNYTSVLLQRCGLHVLHEKRMGGDGISSWLFGAETSAVPWGPSPADYSFEHICHLVRDPLSAIPSIATFRPAAWDYIADHVRLDASDSVLLKSAKYWLGWNLMVEKRANIRLRIEDMPGAVAPLGDRIGVRLDISAIERVPQDLNTRRYGSLLNLVESKCLEIGLVPSNAFLKKLLSNLPPEYEDLTWEDLLALDPSLGRRIYAKALEYGYDYPSRGPAIPG